MQMITVSLKWCDPNIWATKKSYVPVISLLTSHRTKKEAVISSSDKHLLQMLSLNFERNELVLGWKL